MSLLRLLRFILRSMRHKKGVSQALIFLFVVFAILIIVAILWFAIKVSVLLDQESVIDSASVSVKYDPVLIDWVRENPGIFDVPAYRTGQSLKSHLALSGVPNAGCISTAEVVACSFRTSSGSYSRSFFVHSRTGVKTLVITGGDEVPVPSSDTPGQAQNPYASMRDRVIT